MPTFLAPAAIPSAASTSSTVPARSPISPLLSHLLELHSPLHLSLLVQQTIDAISSLPQEDQPTTYEGLLDVARFCVDDEPGWKGSDKKALLDGHPRIGETAKGAHISASSKVEQGKGAGDAETDKALRRLNFLYERRFPGLRYVTYVAGRPRSAIVDELKELLGERLASLPPANLDLDPNEPDAWTGFPADDVKEEGSEEYDAEMERGIDALFNIANDRADKLTKAGGVLPDPEPVPAGDGAADASGAPSKDAKEGTAAATTKDASNDFKDDKDLTAGDEKAAGGSPAAAHADPYSVPFLDISTFRALVLSSPLLTNFFTTDLPASFVLEAPAPQQESAREAIATLAAVAATGGGGGDSTRKRVKGLLGGLLGEVGDRVAKVTGRETRTGPRPSFGGRATTTLEELGVGGSGAAKGAKSAMPSAMGYQARRKASGIATTSSNSPAAGDGAQQPSDKAEAAIEGAEESLRAATKALQDRDGAAFVIDEAGEEGGEEDDEAEEGLVEGLGPAGGEGGKEGGKVTGREAQIAKDLRSAPAQ